MSIKRRKFVTSALAGVGGVVVVTDWGCAENKQASPSQRTDSADPPAQSSEHDPTATVPLGKHLKVSRIGVGTGVKASQRRNALQDRGKDHAIRVIQKCYDEGVRLFDLADLYGSHQMVAEALRDKPRDSYALVSKIWFRKGGIPEDERPDADVVVKRFLKELGTDYLDLVQLHCTTRPEWTTEQRDQMGILSRLKEDGVIRSHGTSCHSIAALEAAAADPWVDVVHTRINPEGTKMDGPPEKVVPVLKKIHAAGKGIIGMKTIGEGQFRDDDALREKSIHFVVGLGCVDVMIAGFEHEWEIGDYKKRVARALITHSSSS